MDEKIGDERIDAQIDEFIANERLRLLAAAGACGSPIEQLMLLALMRTRPYARIPCPMFIGPTEFIPEQTCWCAEFSWGDVVALQVNLSCCDGAKYRADFVLSRKTPRGPIRIVIECDGHDFHERTPEQAERDKKRDRDLQAAGFHIARFTGREIVRDPDAVARSVWDLLTVLEQRRGDV